MNKLALVSLAVVAVGASSAVGQITIVGSGATANQVNVNGAYTQNFNDFGTGTVTFANNSTLPGWSVTSEASETSFAASTGTSTAGAIYNFGSSSAADRAWGYVGSSSNDWTNLALQLVNSSGLTITAISVSYNGELWRSAGAQTTNSNNTFSFFYRIGNSGSITLPDSDVTTSWTAVTSLNYAPSVSVSVGALDGNANATSVTASFLVSFLPGQEIWLRWRGVDGAGTDAGIAIDDLTVSFTAVPEPSSYAGVLGLVALAGVALRRRRQVG